MKPLTASEKLIQALELTDLPEPELSQTVDEIGSLIYRQSLLKMIESMPEETRELFITLMEHEGTEEEIEAFLKKHVPDADSFIEQAADSLADDILLVSDTIDN